MTNTALLKDRISQSGLKLGFIAEQLGTSYHWLNKKINGHVPFKVCEIQTLCKILNITSLEDKDEIFFAENVENISTQREE